jgi:hypothetical protein
MAYSMQDAAALRRYIGRTTDLLGVTTGERAQVLLRQMIRDAEGQLALRDLVGPAMDTGNPIGSASEAGPMPLGGSAIALHRMTDAQLTAGIRDATEIASRMIGENEDATQLLLAGIELAISELVMRSDPEAR